MQILVKFDDFILYQEKYNTYYLDKKHSYRIWSPAKSFVLNGFKPVNEMFDGIKTEYIITNINDDFQIFFISDSGNEYKFDLKKEPKTNIYHLSFSLKDRNDEEYEKLTNLNESNEVFGRLSYILKDLNDKLDVDEYCIGATGDLKKDKIYQYMMKFVTNWEKRNTKIYDLGWALYFKL